MHRQFVKKSEDGKKIERRKVEKIYVKRSRSNKSSKRESNLL